MVQTATNTFYNRAQEREAKAQEREKRKETRQAKVLATLHGGPMTNPESLKDKAWGKCLICRQVKHWAKECPNHEKPPKTAYYNVFNWYIGWLSALGTQEPPGQAPSLPSQWFNRTKLAHSSQPACHRKPSRGQSQEYSWMCQVAVRISWLTQGLPTFSWSPTPEFSSPKLVPFVVL